MRLKAKLIEAGWRPRNHHWTDCAVCGGDILGPYWVRKGRYELTHPEHFTNEGEFLSWRRPRRRSLWSALVAALRRLVSSSRDGEET